MNLEANPMVVMRESRDDLALALRRLVSGRMTNDDFDNKYYETWHGCEDSAVGEIANFGWELYSSDLPLPYKLKGRYAVSTDVREIASRAVLFLQTDLDYEWPTNLKGVVPYFCLWGPGCYLVFGLVFLFVAAFSTGSTAVVCGIGGLLAIIPTFHWLATHKEREKELQAFHASGDFFVWPFKNQDDFSKAKESPRYLAGLDDCGTESLGLS